MSLKKFYVIVFAFAFLFLIAFAPLAVAAEGTRTVVDMGGTEVTLPMEVNRVIDMWHANNQVVLLLGGADKLIGTTEVIQQLPWYGKVYPRIRDVKAFTGPNISGFNAEEVLAAKPDVVIVSTQKDAEVLRNAGITAVFVTFRDFDGLKETVRVTAKVLGGDAEERAEKFISYFEGNLQLLNDRLGDLPDSQRPKVYEVRSPNPLDTDGRVSICTEWLAAAGGVNAIADIAEDNQTTVTMEEVLKADPDYIIIGTQNAVGSQNADPIAEKIKNAPEWSTVKAVKEGRVYTNPVGTFLWARYSCEEALQVLWVAKLLHPDKFADIDLTKQVRDFYKTFYDFDLTDADAERMLAGRDPL
ncbi:MAG: ABC transporter substrate-binding protein [Synergistaceae bacterium]|jgi:iron complex transport system substrate-binding protein|nr:ABC transporter substrate-binding protein [Synergistaceae bacterium]